MGNFFENFILGIMSEFSDSINDVRQALAEKTRSLRGMQEMIKLAKNYISTGLPQVRFDAMNPTHAYRSCRYALYCISPWNRATLEVMHFLSGLL